MVFDFLCKAAHRRQVFLMALGASLADMIWDNVKSNLYLEHSVEVVNYCTCRRLIPFTVLT